MSSAKTLCHTPNRNSAGFQCDDRTSNTRNLIELLQEVDFKQQVREPTHVGDHILDLVITRNCHNTISSTSF